MSIIRVSLVVMGMFLARVGVLQRLYLSYDTLIAIYARLTSDIVAELEDWLCGCFPSKITLPSAVWFMHPSTSWMSKSVLDSRIAGRDRLRDYTEKKKGPI